MLHEVVKQDIEKIIYKMIKKLKMKLQTSSSLNRNSVVYPLEADSAPQNYLVEPFLYALKAM